MTLDKLAALLEPHPYRGPGRDQCEYVYSDRTVCGGTFDDHMSERAREAARIVRELVEAAPARPACEPPAMIECPRGCGFLTSARPHVQWGPWRMQAHLMSQRCPAAIPGMTTTTRRR